MSQFLAYTSGCPGLGGLVEWEVEPAMLLYFPALGERKNQPGIKEWFNGNPVIGLEIPAWELMIL